MEADQWGKKETTIILSAIKIKIIKKRKKSKGILS